MKTKQSHTPTPWRFSARNSCWIVDDKGNDIATVNFVRHGNAEFIVRAVNSHEALLEAANNVIRAYRTGAHIGSKVVELEVVVAKAEGKL